MPRWPTGNDPYGGRKRPQAHWPKASIGSQTAPAHFASGGRVSGGKSTRHPEGLGTVKSGYLTGKAGGEAHPNYHRTARKRNQADYRGGRGEK
jgi:hypothetical protein